MIIPFQFRADWHQVITPDFMNFLKEKFPDHAEHLFVYRHTLWGSFVIAGWVQKERGRMCDLVNLGTTLDLTREKVKEMEQLLFPKVVMTGKTLTDGIVSGERALDQKAQDDSDELLDYKKAIVPRDGGGSYFSSAREHGRLKHPTSVIRTKV